MNRDLQILTTATLEEPKGWVWVPFGRPDPDFDLLAAPGVKVGDTSLVGRPLPSGEVRCFPQGILPARLNVIRVDVAMMHQSGRDTRVRHIRIMSPLTDLHPLPTLPATHTAPQRKVSPAVASHIVSAVARLDSMHPRPPRRVDDASSLFPTIR
jgi:hypothetical protein